MKFRTRVTSAKEVLFVGHELGNARPAADWLEKGRWKVSLRAFDDYLTAQLHGASFGPTVDEFVFCFEIADFELWGQFFAATASYTSYRPKQKAIWSVGQLRWSDVKDLPAGSQLSMLREVLLVSIRRIGAQTRQPRDFRFADFAATVERYLAEAPEQLLTAIPAVRQA